jgi:hypothetical protein
MGGYIMQIQNYSVNDGEGIRTTIFLAGCPLRCMWCANPEGQTLRNPMTRYVRTAEILTAVRRQMIFYRKSGGGVTFSGGEATVQTEFLRELAGEIYDMAVPMAIETCGEFSFEEIRDILEKMDQIFYDIKLTDRERHRYFTGKDNDRILENAKRVYGLGIPMVIRMPVLLGVNGDEKSIRELIGFLAQNCPMAKLEFLPYHTLGEEKYRQLGRELPPEEFQRPSDKDIETWCEMAEQAGIETVSYR